MAASGFKFFWTTHKWVGIIAAVVFLNIGVTGFLLLIKKQVPWIQPPEQKGSATYELTADFDAILESIRVVPEAGIQSWKDVDRLDVRPKKGILKVVPLNNRWEIQVDLRTAQVLQVEYRRSDLIEQLHDGSFYGSWVHGWVMPAIAFCLLYLVFSGLYLWIEPALRRRKRRANPPPRRSPRPDPMSG